MKILLKLLPFFALLALNSCAGYRLGGTKPIALAHVNKIHVPLALNSTQIPRAASFVTNGVVDALVDDGTYLLGTFEDSDARLEVQLYEVTFAAVRTADVNRLRPEELSMTVHLRWRVVDANDVGKVLDSGTSTGRTGLFVEPNLQAAQQSQITDAIQRASISLIARLSDGFGD